MRNIHPVLLAIIIANVLFSLKGFNDLTFFNRFKFQVGAIKAGERIRMFTSAFLHADWMHLGFNMYALFLFGKIVIGTMGVFHFLVVYFGSLMTGSIYSFYINRNKDYYSAIGASGAVSGIVFSAIVLYPGMKLFMIPIPIEIPGYIFGVGYLLYSIYGMKNQVGNIGHSAHIGGAIGGYALTILFRPYVIQQNTTMILVMGAIIVGLLLFGDRLKLNP